MASSDSTTERPQTTSLWPFLAAAAVLVVVLVAVIGVTVLGDTPAKRSTAERSASSGHAAELVVHDGDTVSGQGEVVAIPGRPVRFCAPTNTAPSVPTGSIKTCAIGVDVTGVNLGRLTQRRSSGGRVAGLAGLAGTYRHGTLKVTVQSSYVAPPAASASKLPCAAPAGGWPGKPVELSPAQAYAASHVGAIVEAVLVRPGPSEVVAYVLTAGDPAPVRAALAPTLGPGLCVARSRYSRAQLDRAKAALQALPGLPRLNSVLTVGAGSLTSAGQPEVAVAVPVVSQPVADAVDAQPAGLVRLSAWLSPTS